MKKSYQSPTIEVEEIETGQLLAGSVEGFQQNLINEEDDLITDPSDIFVVASLTKSAARLKRFADECC